jgi:hypothetical protein
MYDENSLPGLITLLVYRQIEESGDFLGAVTPNSSHRHFAHARIDSSHRANIGQNMSDRFTVFLPVL